MKLLEGKSLGLLLAVRAAKPITSWSRRYPSCWSLAWSIAWPHISYMIAQKIVVSRMQFGCLHRHCDGFIIDTAGFLHDTDCADHVFAVSSIMLLMGCSLAHGLLSGSHNPWSTCTELLLELLPSMYTVATDIHTLWIHTVCLDNSPQISHLLTNSHKNKSTHQLHWYWYQRAAGQCGWRVCDTLRSETAKGGYADRLGFFYTT